MPPFDSPNTFEHLILATITRPNSGESVAILFSNAPTFTNVLARLAADQPNIADRSVVVLTKLDSLETQTHTARQVSRVEFS